MNIAFTRVYCIRDSFASNIFDPAPVDFPVVGPTKADHVALRL